MFKISDKSNKYETRKKKIDFAKIGEKLSLTGSNCHFCKSTLTVQDSNACRSNSFIYIIIVKNFNFFLNCS